MYKYIGEFSDLEKLGFIKSRDSSYYFLPVTLKRNNKDRFLSPLTVVVNTRLIEYSYESQLDILKSHIRRV